MMRIHVAEILENETVFSCGVLVHIIRVAVIGPNVFLPFLPVFERLGPIASNGFGKRRGKGNGRCHDLMLLLLFRVLLVVVVVVVVGAETVTLLARVCCSILPLYSTVREDTDDSSSVTDTTSLPSSWPT